MEWQSRNSAGLSKPSWNGEEQLLVGLSVVLAERHDTRRATTPAASYRQAKACA
ncbi:MAG: hypothetical protein ACJA0V_003616, partial [Planctomycetota bacterium]